MNYLHHASHLIYYLGQRSKDHDLISYFDVFLDYKLVLLLVSRGFLEHFIINASQRFGLEVPTCEHPFQLSTSMTTEGTLPYAGQMRTVK